MKYKITYYNHRYFAYRVSNRYSQFDNTFSDYPLVLGNTFGYETEVEAEQTCRDDAAEFEWDDDLDINYIGCSQSACEKYFKENK